MTKMKTAVNHDKLKTGVTVKSQVCQTGESQTAVKTEHDQNQLLCKNSMKKTQVL